MTDHSLSRTAARRIACAAVAAEIGRLRDPALPRVAATDWPDALPLGDGGLELDSMERLGAIGALAELFDLGDATLPTTPPATVGAWLDWIVQHHASESARIIVASSGSTGCPQRHVHALAELLDEATFFARQLPDCRRVVALVPAHHLYGLIWTALLPQLLDVPVVARVVGEPLLLDAGDLVVAVPDQWQAMLRLTRRFPAGVIGVSSAAPLDNRLADELRTAGLARLIDIYGSSETSAIAMRTLPATAYELLPRWQWLPHEDVGSDHVSDTRIGDARGNAYLLPDHVERIGARGLRPTGRRDGMVQVGGHNVSPARVAELLRATGGVADAAVRLGSDGRLKAFIVPTTDADTLAPLLQQVIATRLASHEQPRHLRFGDALPRTAMGKLKDWS